MTERLWRVMPAVKVKICGVDSLGFALDCYDLGVDALGFHLWEHEFKSNEHRCKISVFARIVANVPSDMSCVLVTNLKETHRLLRVLSQIPFNTIQLHAEFSEHALEHLVEKLREFNSDLRIIGVVSMKASELRNPLMLAMQYQRVCDALLLDSSWKGGSGRTHNWRRSAAIVRHIEIPCLLAGGLTAKNVVRAIKIVQPYGVDVQSGVERKGLKVKSILKVQQFVRAVRSLGANKG